MNACTKCFHSFALSPFWNTLLVNRPSGSLILLQLQLEPQTHAYHKHERDWNNAKTPKNILLLGHLSCQNHTSVTRGVDSPEPLVYIGLHWSVGAWQLFNWRCTSKMNRSCSSWNWHKKQPKITQESIKKRYDSLTDMIFMIFITWTRATWWFLHCRCSRPRFALWSAWPWGYRDSNPHELIFITAKVAWSGINHCYMQLRYACKWCSLQSKIMHTTTLHKECSEKCQSRVWTPMLSFLVCAHSSPITAGSAFAKMKLYPIACMKPEGQRGSKFQIHKLQSFGLLSLLPLHAACSTNCSWLNAATAAAEVFCALHLPFSA